MRTQTSITTRLFRLSAFAFAAAIAVGCGGPQDGPTVTDPPEGGTTGTTSEPATDTNAAIDVDPETSDSTGLDSAERDRLEILYDAVAQAVDRARNGDFAGAKTDLQQLVSEPDVAAEASYALGTIAYFETQTDLALDYFDAALTANPTFSQALLATVRIHLRDGNTAEAQRVVDRQLSATDNAPEIEAVGLYIPLHEGRYERVITDARAVLLAAADNLDAHYVMAQANLSLDRVELARYIAQIALERDAARPDFYFLLADIELRASNTPGAMSFLRQALNIEPQHPEAHNNLGVLQLELRSYSDAQASFEAATTYAPNYAEAWMNLGSAMKAQGDVNGAHEAFDRAIRIDATYAAPHYNLGILYLDAEINELTRLQRCESALQYFSDFRSLAGRIDDEHPVERYTSDAQQCVSTELDLASQEEEAARWAVTGCLDGGGQPCEEGADCMDRFGDLCMVAAGGCVDDFGFECESGPDCFTRDGELCAGDDGGSDSGGGCVDEWGFECESGPDCFGSDGAPCAGGAGASGDADVGCTDDWGLECESGPDCYDSTGALCGGGGGASQDTASPTGACFDDWGFECDGGPDCYDEEGAPCGS